MYTHFEQLTEFNYIVQININMVLFVGSALHYGWVVSGPIQITLSILGVIGNVLSIIVFTRPTMKSDINFILIGKYTKFSYSEKAPTLF